MLAAGRSTTMLDASTNPWGSITTPDVGASCSTSPLPPAATPTTSTMTTAGNTRLAAARTALASAVRYATSSAATRPGVSPQSQIAPQISKTFLSKFFSTQTNSSIATWPEMLSGGNEFKV